MQQGLDLKDLTGNFDVLRRRVDGLGTQVLNVQNQQTAGGIRDTTFQDGVNRAIEDNARRQQQALDIMQGNITREVEATRESNRLGLQNARQALQEDLAIESTATRLQVQDARQALDTVAQSQLEYRQELQQGMQNTADRQQQALDMMRESLTQGITRRDLDIVRGSINEGLTQNEDTQRALVRVVEGVTAVSRQQDEQARQADETQESMAMLSRGLTNVAQGQYDQGNSVLKLQTDITRGGNAIAGLQADMTRGINAFSTLRNDMDTGMAWLAQQGAMNTQATQQIAGNLGTEEALKDIYGDEFAIEMPPQTPTPSSPPTTQTDSKVSSSVDPQADERPELGKQPPAEPLNKGLGRPKGSKSEFKYKGNPILDDFFEEVIAEQQDTGKRVNWATKPFIVDLIETQGAKLPQLRNRLAQMNTQRKEDEFFKELDEDQKKAPKSIKVKTKTKTVKKKKDKNKK